MPKIIMFILILLHLSSNSHADSYSSFHQNYLNGTLLKSKVLNIKHINSDILMIILDKIYIEESERCEKYGTDYNLSDYTFFIKNNPFSIIKISQDNEYDVVVNEEEFNCGDDGNAMHRGGTGGQIFKIFLNPSKNNINKWNGKNQKIPLVNNQIQTVSNNGVYYIFARSLKVIDNQLFISIHGSSCDVAGYKECYKRYNVSFNGGFVQVGDPITEMK